MISQLGRLHPQSLSVIARTSIMRYKKSDKPIDQIGRELGVDYILEGSARREAGRVRVSAELIQVRNQTELWAETYERELAGILALQSDVAQRVAGALALKLLPAQQARLANVRSVNPEAYDAYLRGLQHWHRLTPGDLESAEKYFKLALEKDPNYAPAHAGIALVWIGRSQMGITRPSEAGPKGKAAALKAVALDDTVAEGHYVLAIIRAWTDWDWAGAEPEFRRAIEINPSFPDARAYYSHFLMIMRRPEEAMPQMERALQLDPFNSLFQGLYGMDLSFARRYDDAIVQLRDTLSTEPDNPIARSTPRVAYHHKGMYEEAYKEWKAAYAAKDDRELEEALARGHLEGGYTGAMFRAAETLASRSRTGYVPAWQIATLYIRAGKYRHAVEWFDKAYEERDPNMPYLSVDPLFDGLRGAPRFQDLLRRMKLPQ